MTDHALTLNRIEIRGGNLSSGMGGGVLKQSGTLLIKDSLIDRNQAFDGGGIYTPSGGVRVERSRIVGNTAVLGGGIFGAVALSRTTVAGNQARSLDVFPGIASGGGIYVHSFFGGVSSRLSLTRSRVLENHSDGDGGGVFSNGETVRVTKSTIADNSAGVPPGLHAGGGIFSFDGRALIAGSTISGNRSDFNGGGIANLNSELTLTDSTVAGNQAASYGGGIDNYNLAFTLGESNVTLNGVTVAYNDADSDHAGASQGGGLQNGADSGTFTVKNSLIARNQGAVGPDCAGFPFASNGHNLLGRSQDCFDFSAPGDLIRPIPKLAKLANNGGPTKTVALRRGSPAINHAGPDAPPRDQRGVKRFHARDIGAYELRPK